MLSTQQRLRLDRQAQIDYAINEGIERGREKERYELIKRLYKNHSSINDISKLLDMSVKEVERYIAIAQQMDE